LDWSTLPDLAVVALLVCAFASVARHSHTAVSGLWQTGWILIALHFAAFIFLPTPGFWGIVAVDVGTTALAGAGILFMYASIPYSKSRSTVGMLFIMLGVNTIYITLICWESSPAWALEIAAALFGMIPLMVALYRLPRINHPLRWTTVGIYCALSIYLLLVQNHPSTGRALALDGLLFAVISCSHIGAPRPAPSSQLRDSLPGRRFSWLALCLTRFCPNFRLKAKSGTCPNMWLQWV
jgi:hypothetical protein